MPLNFCSNHLKNIINLANLLLSSGWLLLRLLFYFHSEVHFNLKICDRLYAYAFSFVSAKLPKPDVLSELALNILSLLNLLALENETKILYGRPIGIQGWVSHDAIEINGILHSCLGDLQLCSTPTPFPISVAKEEHV